MTTYTYAQIEGIWINNGGSKAKAPLAAAIAEAESGGNADATSSNPDGGTNVGLWQLDTPGGKGAGHSVAQLQDPNTNAKVAVAGSNGGADWSAWQTFGSGAYRAFLNNGTTPDTNVPGGSGAAPAAAATASYTTADCLFGFPGVSVPVVGSVGGFCIVSKSNARAMLGGALMLAGGLALMVGVLVIAAGAFTDTSAGQKAGRAVKKVAEVAPFIAAA
jgi:lysozyme-like protein